MKIRASFVFIILIFSIPILGQKRTAEDEKLKLTGQKRTQTAQKTKISKLGDCAVGDGTRVCGGRVIETFVFGIVKVCEDGKMVLKRRTDIDEDFKLRNFDKRDCTWRGQVYCDGDLVLWWFMMVCTNGKIRMVPRQWRDVVNDSRFEN